MNVVALNPNQVKVKNTPSGFKYFLVPHKELAQIARTKKPDKLYRMIPQHLRKKISNQEDILLDSKKVEIIQGRVCVIKGD